MSGPNRSDKPAVGNDLEPAKADVHSERAQPAQQRLSAAKPLEIPEQVVGSRHRFPATLPLNVDSASGVATATVRPEGSAAFGAAFDADNGIFQMLHGLAPFKPAAAEVAFNPTHAGTFDGDLSLAATWEDGHREMQAIPVHASARNIDEIPTSTVVPSAVAAPPGRQPQNTEGDNKNFDAAFTSSAAMLLAKAQVITLLQKDGVTAVGAEKDKYKRELPEPSMWWDLLETALVMGTAGIAAMAGGLVVKEAEHLFANEKIDQGVEKTIAVATNSATGSSAQGAEAAIEHSAAHSSSSASSHAGHAGEAAHGAESVEKKEGGEKLANEGLQTAVEDGLKHPVEKALEEHPKTSGTEDTDFFTAQATRLDFAWADATSFATHMQEALLPLLRTNRRAAIASIDATAAVLDKVAQRAVGFQKDRTSVEYASYVARASLGSTRAVARDGKSEEVTDLDKSREFSGNFEGPGASDGLLDIYVDIEKSAVNVTGARITGLSHTTARRLLEVNLADPAVRMPMRFVLNPGGLKHEGAGFITRDEAGRVQVEGYKNVDPDGRGFVSGPQEIRGAEGVVASVLARTLKDWGVARIETDDAGDKEAGEKEQKGKK